MVKNNSALTPTSPLIRLGGAAGPTSNKNSDENKKNMKALKLLTPEQVAKNEVD